MIRNVLTTSFLVFALTFAFSPTVMTAEEAQGNCCNCFTIGGEVGCTCASTFGMNFCGSGCGGTECAIV